MENQEILDIQEQIERLNAMPHSTGDFYLEEPWWGYIVMRGDQQALYGDRFSWVISPVYRHARDLGIWLDGYLRALEDAYHFTADGARWRGEEQPVVAR